MGIATAAMRSRDRSDVDLSAATIWLLGSPVSLVGMLGPG
jgi:hypothetical protein